MEVHRGDIFHIEGDPHVARAADSLVEYEDGGIAFDSDGVIRWCGNWADRPMELLADATVYEHSNSVIFPGFIDTHIHFPQVYAGDSYGGGELLEWLTSCIFPAEARLKDEAFSRMAVREFVDRLVAAGTTNSLVFGSQFPATQDLLFEEYNRRGLRGVIGRTTQTTGPSAAEPLITTEDEALALCTDEIERWHPSAKEAETALTYVALVPRFALAVTTRTLEALGELYDHYRSKGLYFTSHLNENNRPGDGEVVQVRMLYGVQDYLDTYDGKFLPGSKVGGKSFLGPRSVMAHSVWCTDRELSRLAETDTSIAHCPNSQLFLGSGVMPWQRTITSGVTVSMGTDFAAGDSWFMPYVMNQCFKQHMAETSATISLHPAQLLHLATVAGAKALDMSDRSGNFDVGKEADFVIIEPERWEPLAHTLAYGKKVTDDPLVARDARLFTILMLSNQINLTETYVRGKKLARKGDQ